MDVDALDDIVGCLRAAVSGQDHDPDPSHDDFYAWGWQLSELTRTLLTASRMLAEQVEHYGDRRVLRDDEDDVDAMERLAAAAAALRTLNTAMSAAAVAAREYHATIGHIGVEVDPAGDEETS